jgi:hypothetical protein
MSVSTKMSTEAAIVRLAKMTVPQLQQRHAELFGEESRTPHRHYLFRKLAWELQAREEGRLPEEVRQYALGIAREAKLGAWIAQNVSRLRSGVPLDRTATTSVTQTHDFRVPMPGSLIVREFKNHSWDLLSSSADHRPTPARGGRTGAHLLHNSPARSQENAADAGCGSLFQACSDCVVLAPARARSAYPDAVRLREEKT